MVCWESSQRIFCTKTLCLYNSTDMGTFLFPLLLDNGITVRNEHVRREIFTH